MSPSEQKVLISRFFDELYSQGRTAILDEAFSPDAVRYSNRAPAAAGAKAIGQYVLGLRSIFPDLHVSVDDTIAEGDKVMAWITVSGTHRGPFMDIPPTGKRISIAEVQVFRFERDKVVDVRVLGDVYGLLTQLGAVITPEQHTARAQ